MSETQTAGTPSQTEEIGSLVASASDALTDDMVGRLAGTFGEALDVLDRINRSRLARALPAGRLARLPGEGTAGLRAAREDSDNDQDGQELSHHRRPAPAARHALRSACVRR